MGDCSSREPGPTSSTSSGAPPAWPRTLGDPWRPRRIRWPSHSHLRRTLCLGGTGGPRARGWIARLRLCQSSLNWRSLEQIVHEVMRLGSHASHPIAHAHPDGSRNATDAGAEGIAFRTGVRFCESVVPDGQLAGQTGRTVRFHVSFITVANDPYQARIAVRIPR